MEHEGDPRVATVLRLLDAYRREFGLEWNQPLPGGGLLVSNEVTLLLSASAVKGE